MAFCIFCIVAVGVVILIHPCGSLQRFHGCLAVKEEGEGNFPFDELELICFIIILCCERRRKKEKNGKKNKNKILGLQRYE